MNGDITKTEKKGGFSFGIMIFGLFVLLPAMFAAGVAYDMKNTQDLKMECLKQNKSYVNGLCLGVNSTK